MMILILLISFVSVYFFFSTYRKEMAEKKIREAAAEIKEAADEVLPVEVNPNG